MAVSKDVMALTAGVDIITTHSV